jgi:hypothetical protein
MPKATVVERDYRLIDADAVAAERTKPQPAFPLSVSTFPSIGRP